MVKGQLHSCNSCLIESGPFIFCVVKLRLLALMCHQLARSFKWYSQGNVHAIGAPAVEYTLPHSLLLRIFCIVVGHRLNGAAAEQREGYGFVPGMDYWVPALGHISCVGFLFCDGKGITSSALGGRRVHVW